MFQTKVVENTETHFMFSNFFFFFENIAVNEMMWKNTVQPDMPLMRMLGYQVYKRFFVLRTHKRDMMKNVYWASCEVPGILVMFK